MARNKHCSWETLFWEKVDKQPSDPEYAAKRCWKWTASQRNGGYGGFWILGKKQLAHRVAYELANGVISDGACILHSCDNRLCVNPEHLREGTLSDNSIDIISRRRRSTSLTLEPWSVLFILWARSELPITQSEIGNVFGVARRTVRDIERGHTWSHLFEEKQTNAE